MYQYWHRIFFEMREISKILMNLRFTSISVTDEDTKAEDVPINSKPAGEDNIIHVQQVQKVQESMGWPSIMWG